MTGLSAGQRVIVRFPGNKRAWGVIKEVDEIARKYRVLLDMAAEPEWFAMSRVRPDTRKPTAKLEPLKVEWGPELEPLPPPRVLPKPDLPEECPAWLAFVRKLPCCNCGATQSIEAHHEGKKGLSQKVRDTMAVPLCRLCHSVYTLKNALPDSIESPHARRQVLLTREESMRILRDHQEFLLMNALAQLDQTERIEILSKGIANIRKPGELAKLLGRVGEAA